MLVFWKILHTLEMNDPKSAIETQEKAVKFIQN